MSRRQRKQKRQKPRRRNNFTNYESPSVTFLDPRKFVSLKYVESFTINLATTVGSQQTMNLNSIFDPNRTGTGHQPYGYDQLAVLYNRYRVHKTHWKVTFGTQAGTYSLVVLPTNGLVSSSVVDASTYQTVCEYPHAKVRTQGGLGSPSIVVSGSILLHKLNGVSVTEYNGDDRFEAQIGASPTEIMTLTIGVLNTSVGTINSVFTVEMTYWVELHDPILIAGS